MLRHQRAMKETFLIKNESNRENVAKLTATEQLDTLVEFFINIRVILRQN
jgi:hypothetical protein